MYQKTSQHLINCSKNNVLLKEEEKNCCERQTECTFSCCSAETSDETPKYEKIVSNLDKLFETIEKGITPKELQFFYGGENSENFPDYL